MKKLRVGIIGLGRVASKTHIPVLRSFPEVAVVAGAEQNPERAERVRKLFGLERVYPGYRELCEAGGLDAVYVCLPNFLHREACESALKNGLHVLCEKPMGMSVEEAESLARLAEERRLVLMPGYKKRYSDTFAQARKMVGEGLIGKVIHVQGTFVTAGPYISWDPKSDWYLDEKWQGVIYDTACHLVDLLFYVVPGEVARVRGIAQAGFTGYATPTNVVCSFESKDGALGSLVVGWRGGADTFGLSVHGTAGTIHVDREALEYSHPGTDPVDRILFHAGNALHDTGALMVKVGDKVRGMNFYREDLRQAAAFIRAIRDGADPPVTARDGVNVHRFLGMLVEAVHRP